MLLLWFLFDRFRNPVQAKKSSAGRRFRAIRVVVVLESTNASNAFNGPSDHSMCIKPPLKFSVKLQYNCMYVPQSVSTSIGSLVIEFSTYPTLCAFNSKKQACISYLFFDQTSYIELRV